jgi:hypothetical protein
VHLPRPAPPELKIAVGACVALVFAGSCATSSDAVSIDEARTTLLGYVIDVPGADGYRYAVTDDQGHELDTAKIIDVEDGFAAVYHWWDDPNSHFVTSLATSNDLLHWTWRVDLGVLASQPTIQLATDGGYVVAWEQEQPSQDNSHLRFNYYPSWTNLLAATPTKSFDAQLLLSECAEGTPNLYAVSSTHVEFGFHFFYNCEVDQQAHGESDWTSWTATQDVLLNRAAWLQGYTGSVGDRDMIDFEGHRFTFLEAQFVPGDWRTFRVLLYDDGVGARDRSVIDDPPDPASQFPDIPPEPPSTYVGIWTHQGSRSLTNLTISNVTLDGRRAIVVAVFIPRENDTSEAGELIYYRLLDD